MDYTKLSRSELTKTQMCNPPDVPHYQKALEERKRRDQIWILIFTVALTALTLISQLFALGHTVAAQVKQESLEHLLTMNQRFLNYRTDFEQLGQSRNFDWMNLSLEVVADQTVVHLEDVETMLAIYHTVSNKQDRLAIWPLITDHMDSTRKRLDSQIEVANTVISVLKTPGAVTEAMHMRDDLRTIQEDLDGARKAYEAAEAKLPRP